MRETTHRIAGPGGGALRVTDLGDAGAPTVVVHHGTPGNGSVPPPAIADARARGLRVIAYDRPGYGGSSPQPGRTVADCAADVAAIADALGVERFVTWGVSGGGPHALACAALLGERVAAAATVSAAGPYGEAGLDFLAGMGEGNVEEFGAAIRGRRALEPLLEREAQEMLGAGVEAVVEGMRSVLSDVDAAALTGELGAYVHASFRDGLAPGVAGWRDDDLAFVAPWGFALDAIAVPVLVAQGHQDLMVPPAHGAWLATHVPGAQARMRADEGHITLLGAIAEIHGWLLERLERPRARAQTPPAVPQRAGSPER